MPKGLGAMNLMRFSLPATLCLALVAGLAGILAAATEPPLPAGAGPVWDSATAWRSSSQSRGRVCLNGLWRFRSAAFPGPAAGVSDGLDTPGLEGWVLEPPGRGSCRLEPDSEIKQAGAGALRLTVDIPPQTNFYHLTRPLMLQPDTAYTLAVAVRTELTSGYVALEVQDLRNRFDGAAPEIFLAQATERVAGKTPWRRLMMIFRTRPGGGAHRLLVRYYGGADAWKGTVWLDELTISERTTAIPAVAAPPADDAWGFAKVPGNPRSSEMVTYWHRADPVRGKPGEMGYAWYEREAQVPPGWGGRRVVVSFERVSTRLRLYCNGEPAGEAGWFGGEVDITRWAQPGSTVRLSALVRGLAADDVSELVSEGGLASWQRQAGSCGLGGDVWLDSGPATGPRLGPFLIQTRVSDMTIAVTVPLLDLPPAGVPAGLTLVCDVRDGERVVKEFSAPIPAGNRPAVAQAAWPEAECWDIGKPRLYTLTVSLKRGQDTLDQALPESFGFREFEIRGRFFYLNGIRVNLRPCSYNVARLYTLSPECIERWFDRIVAEGRNFVYTETVDSPNHNEALQPVLQAADAHGVLMAVTPLQINPFWQHLAEPAVRTAFAQHLRQRAERVWNHPSLVLYRMNMNFCGYAQDQNPLLLSGEVMLPPDSALGRKFAAAELSSQLMAEVDPSRRSYHHASGNAGAIYTLNNYLCWPEPQDLREWLGVWAERGTKPLMMVEFDLPYPGSFSLLDPTSWWSNEPLMTEYGAILLGERSYALEEDDYGTSPNWPGTAAHRSGNRPTATTVRRCRPSPTSALWPTTPPSCPPGGPGASLAASTPGNTPPSVSRSAPRRRRASAACGCARRRCRCLPTGTTSSAPASRRTATSTMSAATATSRPTTSPACRRKPSTSNLRSGARPCPNSCARSTPTSPDRATSGRHRTTPSTPARLCARAWCS
jgi:hypothetical protein